MNDREFITKLINNYFSHSIDAHQATLDNAITNRLNDIADKLENQEKILKVVFNKGLPLAEIRIIKQSKTYEEYSVDYSWVNWKNASIQKTQEEFDLLKRYFR